jgi:large subunit ribosomal protein L24
MASRNTKPVEPVRIDIKKEDTVKVLAGRDAGKTGRVLRVDRERGRILVEHVAMIKRHEKATKTAKAGIAERESAIHISNVMVVCPACNKAVRMKHQVDHVAGGKSRSRRVCRKCGTALDKK